MTSVDHIAEDSKTIDHVAEVGKMVGLKKCPFCGGEADCNNAGFMQYGWKKWAVECPMCGVVTHFFDTEEKAIEAWNRRAGDGE